MPKMTDASEIIDRMFGGDPDYGRMLIEERRKASIGREIYLLREERGLTHEELAELVGATPSEISQLEDSDYGGYWLGMLDRIASALKCRLKIEFVSAEESAAEGDAGETERIPVSA